LNFFRLNKKFGYRKNIKKSRLAKYKPDFQGFFTEILTLLTQICFSCKILSYVKNHKILSRFLKKVKQK